MVEHINLTRTSHIVTIEDPIEFLIRDKRSIISQREIGTDSKGVPQALRAALRQDPDVILVGEMRDLETIQIAINAAETGHLVFSTLHTNDAADTISRIVSAYPPHQQKQARLQLAVLLRAVVSQRLVPRKDGQGRVPAAEILISTGRIRELIAEEGMSNEIRDAIAQGTQPYGMQTFDQSLRRLLDSDLISYEEALLQATNRDDFALRASGIEGTASADEWYENSLSEAAKSSESNKKLDLDFERF